MIIDLKDINNDEKRDKENKKNRLKKSFIEKRKYKRIIIRLLIYLLTLNITRDKRKK